MVYGWHRGYESISHRAGGDCITACTSAHSINLAASFTTVEGLLQALRTPAHLHMPTHLHVHLSILLYTCTYLRTCVHALVHTQVYTHLHTYTYLHNYTLTDLQTWSYLQLFTRTCIYYGIHLQTDAPAYTPVHTEM